jgi:ABC-2 type transport system permease protein
MTKLARDTWLLFGSNLRSRLRNPVWVFVGAFQPICYMLLFAPLLKNLAGTPGFPSGGAYNIFTPDLMIMMAIIGAGFAGFTVIERMREGVIERLRVTPVSRLAILIGGLAIDVLSLLVQTALIIGIGLLLGFHPNVAGLMILLVLIALAGVAMGVWAYALGLLLKDESSMAGTINLFVMPLMLLSGITLPLTLAPQIIRNVAKLNPFAYAVDAARALVAGHMSIAAIPQAFGIFVVFAIVALYWATNSIRQAAM